MAYNDKALTVKSGHSIHKRNEILTMRINVRMIELRRCDHEAKQICEKHVFLSNEFQM